MRLGGFGLGETPVSVLNPTNYQSQFPLRVQLYHKSGGLIKDWFIGMDSVPFASIKFELNKKICGAGSMKFAYLDFPLHAEDYIIISYKGFLLYRGIIDTSVDLKGGEAKLVPATQILDERLASVTFSNDTVETILEDTIDYINGVSDTGIRYSSQFVSTGTTDTFSPDYSGYEKAKKIIEETVKKLDDREYGINAHNILTVYTPDTEVSQTFLFGDNPPYTEIENETEYGNVKKTRLQVMKKSAGAGETSRIGEVGYGSGYDPLTIETLVRVKEDKYQISELISDDTEALDGAYATLIDDIPNSITVKNFDITRLPLTRQLIGQRWTLEDRIEYQLRCIINCDELTDDDDTMWGGAWGVDEFTSLNTTDYVQGSASISTANNTEYAFNQTINFLQPTLLGFMLKSETATNDFAVAIESEIVGWSTGAWSEGIWSSEEAQVTSYPVNITTAGVWNWYSIPISSGVINTLGFFNSSGAEILLDQVSLYLPARQRFTGDIVQMNFEITPKGINIPTIKLNNYDLQANDMAFEFNKKIAKLESINQDT
jgi:hypothetical protein